MAQATPDLSAFYALSKPKRPPCQIALILRGEITPALKPEERGQLEAALAVDKGVITGSAIQQWLAERGHDVSINRVSNHRRKVCDCGKRGK